MKNTELYRLIDNGQENIAIDFKKEFYFKNDSPKDEKNAKISAMIKDCISFLNCSIGGNKFIVCGLDDEGNPSELFESVTSDEANLQTTIHSYITPTPEIHFTKDQYKGSDIFVIHIDQINPPVLYSVAKDIKLGNSFLIRKGDAYIRRGSRNSQLTTSEIYSFSQNKDKYLSKITLADINSTILQDILTFFHFQSEKLINGDKLVAFIESDIEFSMRYNNVFRDIIQKGLDIVDYKDDFDGGPNSIIHALFFISSKIFNIHNDSDFQLEFSPGIIRVSAKSFPSLESYKKLKITIHQINTLINEFIKIQYKISTYFFKFTKIEISKELLNHFGESEFKFTLSDDVMGLFLEPLYRQSNAFSVAIRELLQNSFDACKENFESDGSVCVDFYFKDNSLNKVTIKDNGIGMTASEIKDYFLKVGNSSKNNQNSELTGKFGIGALSMFMIGDICRISTKKNGHSPISLYLIREQFTVQKLDIKEFSDYDSFTKIDIEVNKDRVITKDEVIHILDIKKQLVQDDFVLNYNFYDSEGSKFKLERNIQPKKITQNLLEDVFTLHEVSVGNNKIAFYIYNPSSNCSPENMEINDFIRSHYDSKLLYNNQLNDLQLNFSRNLSQNSVQKLPLIVCCGSIYNAEGVDVELSRNKFIIESPLSDILLSKYVESVSPKIDQEIKNINLNSSISTLQKLEQIENIYASFNIDRKDIVIINKNLVKSNPPILLGIHVNEISHNTFEKMVSSKDIPFSKLRLITERKQIADLIDKDIVIALQKNILTRFLIRADSSSNGFRQSAGRRILTALGLDYLFLKSNFSFWQVINSNKKLIIDKIEEKSIGNITYLNDHGRYFAHLIGEDNSYGNIVITLSGD